MADKGTPTGLISRFFNRTTEVQTEPNADADDVCSWANNVDRAVQGVVGAVLCEPRCLIVTGYQDFLSTLSIILDTVDDLGERPPGSFRVVFGTNTETATSITGTGRTVDEEARAHFLGARGLSVSDLADLRAVLAMEAIEKGIISFRAYDPQLARKVGGRSASMLHAKLFVGQSTVLSGSANFSIGGLRRNFEFMDDASFYPELADARRASAELFWEMGRDWNQAALETLRNLVRWVTPEEAIARTVYEATNFTPWVVAGDTSTGRPPQPFQAELVYEAAGTIHEHGFAFMEAPTGAGKTDIGKHLAMVLPVSHSQTVFSHGERADQQRLGAIALIPASVLGNWTTSAPTNFKAIKHSHLSRRGKDVQSELEEINRSVRSAAAMIVDESHRLSSRYLAPSARSLVFERSPAIWTACLSATLMGNQGLDGLLAFHEKRASIYVPPQITDQINVHMERVRERGQMYRELEETKTRIDAQAVQDDLFESKQSLQEKVEDLEQTIDAQGLRLSALQAGLAEALAPYVVRRQRACIGESSERNSDAFVYPTVKSHRRDASLSEAQKQIIARIKVLAEAITTGTTLVSSDPKRAAQTEVKFHDKSRIHIRNFLAILRASVTFSREEWDKERDSEADTRGRASIGESLRRAEAQNPKSIPVPEGELEDELPVGEDNSPTRICDRIGRLLRSHQLDDIDQSRATAMRTIVSKHGHAIFLAERVGVLEVYAKLLAGGRGRGLEAFVVAPGAKIKPSKKIHHIRSGADAQKHFGIDGEKVDILKPRAMLMTFQMAEGINLQMASALGIIGVTSDVKSLIQGLGRIDRIDSPHSKIHYYTFDLPGLVLSSDRTARKRVASIALLSGVGAEDLPSELVEFAAGDLTDLVLEQVRKERILRRNNYFDLIEGLRRTIPNDVTGRIEAADIKGLWGADLCLLSTTNPVTILLLGGRTGDTSDPNVLPPRLLAIREIDGQAEVVGDQAEAARLLADAYDETRRRELHTAAPTLAERASTLERLSGPLSQLTHWDARPARTVSLLASLAEFISNEPVHDGGRKVFGDLSSPVLEKLAEEWAHELDVFWIQAKESVSQSSASGHQIPDYLGMTAIFQAFVKQPPNIIEEVRVRMLSLIDHYRDLSEGQPIDLLSRISVIFDARR